jgi:glutamine amidotransferase
MCRWLAYDGDPILLEELLFKPKHSLIDQSMSSKSAETPTNADGFGVGWYGAKSTPALYRSIRPAWNDFNLRDLAAQIEARLIVAHVRATSLATVQETNCHPFRYKNWLFVHNGEVFGIEKFRKRLVEAVADELFTSIMGTTDSEVMFYLCLTFGLRDDPAGALLRMAQFVERVAKQHDVPESLWMTLGVTDGATLYAVRYASDAKAPTLYHTRDVEDIYRTNPELSGKFSLDARIIASEPTGKAREFWVEVPQNSFVTVRRGDIHIRPFMPPPATVAAAVAPAGDLLRKVP